MTTEQFNYYRNLYGNISLQEYLKDKTVEDIVSTCRWFCKINPTVFIEMIEHFNKEPKEDLEYTEATVYYCKGASCDDVCSKCLFPHDDTHKCYAYDRIFRHIFMNETDYDSHVINNWLWCCYNKKPTCRNAPKHNKIGRYEFENSDAGCYGEIANYIRIGSTWFERNCFTCHDMKVIKHPYPCLLIPIQ